MRKAKKKPFIVVLALSAVLVFGASLSVFAATTKLPARHEKWFDATVVMNEIDRLAPLPHYTDDGPAPGLFKDEAAVETFTAKGSSLFEWTVKSKYPESLQERFMYLPGVRLLWYR